MPLINGHTRKINVMKLVLLCSCLIMVLKFAGWWLTRSNAILTDAIESVVNIVAGAFALYSLYYAARPADKDHPYGHGKMEFVSSGFEGGMICIAGIAMCINGISAFFEAPELKNVDTGVAITVVSGLANYFLARLLKKKGELLDSATLAADGKHLLTDSISSAGLVIGLLVIYYTGLVWLDYVLTIILGIAICYTGFSLVRESLFNLLDKADYSKIGHIIKLLNEHRKDSWIDIHNVRLLKYGSVVHVDAHMTFPWYFTLEETHHEVDQVGKLATSGLKHQIEFFIHSDPCRPQSCTICSMKHCRVRQHPQVKKVTWQLVNALPDNKHSSITSEE
jgi:cation diffusion facilitator family transporter